MKKNPDCIFCRIAAGEIPCEKLFEDEYSIAFLDIGPLAPGHSLLIPKEHFETLDQMPQDGAGRILSRLPGLVRAVKGATGCEGVNVLQNNGAAAGQLVGHVHFHVIPREGKGGFEFNWPAGEYGEGEMAAMADAVRAAL